MGIIICVVAMAIAAMTVAIAVDRAALEALETRAIVDAYTQMLLRQQKKERPRIASSRPWL